MDWDDEDYQAPVIDSKLKASWDDEDVEEEEIEPTPVEAAKPTVITAARKKKKDLDAKIKEKEVREQELVRARATREEEDFTGLSEVEIKLRKQKLVEEADFENAKDMFMDGEAGDTKDVQDDAMTLDQMMPKTEADFTKFGDLLSKKLLAIQESSMRSRYNAFLKNLLRSATVDMSADDFKDLVSHVNILSNEKIQAMKGPGAKKTKGKKKAVVKMERSQVLDAYVDDQYDDFL